METSKKWEVHLWGNWEPNEGQDFYIVYTGKSGWEAFWTFMQYRKAFDCVTINYRNPRRRQHDKVQQGKMHDKC